MDCECNFVFPVKFAMGGPDLFQALHFFGSAEAGASNWNLIYNKDIANEDNKKRGVTNT